MNNYKEHKVVLVPTEDQSEIWSHKGRRLYYNQTNLNDPDDEIRYHLYILSDEEVKDRDCVLYEDKYNKITEVLQIDKINDKTVHYTDGEFEHRGNSKVLNTKIIAGTNKKLNTAKIPENFIEQYCNNPVDKVMAEYGWIRSDSSPYPIVGKKLKISTDNEIIIKPIKDSWNKEEVIEIIEEVMSLGYNYHKYGSKLTITQELEGWIKENL